MSVQSTVLVIFNCYPVLRVCFHYPFYNNRNYNMMPSIRALLLVLLLASLSLQDDPCGDLIKQWTDAPETLPAIVYADSGKFLNDLGDYNNCRYNKDKYTYFTISVVNKLAKGIQNIGLCVPLECSADVASNKYSLKIQGKLNEAFKNATNSTVVPFQRLFIYNPDQAIPEMDWSNYMVIVLIIVLIVLGVCGSILGRITKSESKPVRVIKAFSIYDNLVKIITIPKTTQNQNLLFLNGARVFSICWIIYGHDQWFRLSNIKNWTESLDILTTPGIPTLAPAAYFAVDTFFWIGGFLITLGMLEQMKKVRSFLKFYVGCIVHRIIRIWPTYMLAILLYWKIAPYFGSGPIWRTFYNMSCSCNNGGVLWNMFFIDNFGNHGPNGMDYCFGWGWYLAVDFQLFIITPFFLYAYHKNKKLGWIISFVLFLASVITAFTLIMVNNWRYPIPNPKFAPQPEFMDKFYYKPYVRASAYMMGIFSGFIYVQWKANNEAYVNVINKIKNSVFTRILFYVIGIFLVEFVIWIIVPYQQGGQWSTFAQALYNSCNRVVFLIGVYLCCFSAMFGCKHDPTKYILGHWFFSPLAKVSFCMYLTHFIVILDGTFSQRMEMFWQISTSLYNVIADIFFSILLATFLSILVEAPILGLEKIFLRGGGGKGKGKSTPKELETTNEQQLREPLTQSFQKSQESIEINTINQQISIPLKVTTKPDEMMLL